MKWIKKFETFDFTQTLPIVTKSDLTNFYHCDDCDSLWKVLNEEAIICKFCKSSSIEELDQHEWSETVGNRLDEDEDEFLNLYHLNKNFMK
jgi:hypothetical protein